MPAALPPAPAFAVRLSALASMLFASLPCAHGNPARIAPDRAMDVPSLRAGFVRPPASTRPWVHWFWWSNVLSREEIERELGEIAAAGFGTAEIRVVTPYGWPRTRSLPWMDDASLERIGHRRYPYLSPEWLDVMAFTCATAEKLGLRLAINLGQGWPPGGTWITDEHRTKHLVWEATEVEGDREHRWPTPGEKTQVLAWRLRHGTERDVEPDSFIDLGRLSAAATSEIVWSAPPGRWLVGRFTVQSGGLADKGEGPEVDPASPAAVRHHLDHMFSRLDPVLRQYYGTTLIDAAADSWEYEPPRRGAIGRFWSEVLPAAYAERYGHDLAPRFHVLLGYGPDAAEALHALENVEREAVQSAFFAQTTAYLNARGLGSRAQIYGRGLHRDLLEAYTLVDTPEVEQGVYCVPEAIWAARTTGRPIVSSESFTHLSNKMGRVRRPHDEWESNPGHLRGAANELFAEGVNRIQFHSFSYSPPELPYPGWRMYAEIQLNRNTPWWPMIGPLTSWLTRQHWLWQAGIPVADALVYPVQADPPDGPFRTQGGLQPVSGANAIDGANAFTLPLVVQAWQAGRYEARHVVVTRPITTLAEADHLLTLAEGGAGLVSVGHAILDWPALQDRAAGPALVRAARLLAASRLQSSLSSGLEETLANLRSVDWPGGPDRLQFQHRAVQGADLYLVVNLGDDFEGELSFPHPHVRAEIWDADTGRTSAAPRARMAADRQYVHLRLRHAESCALVFIHAEPMPVTIVAATGGEYQRDDDGNLVAETPTGSRHRVVLSDGTHHEIAAPPERSLALDRGWLVSVDASQALSPTAPISLPLEQLQSWRTLPALSRHAGSATYSIQFALGPEWFQSRVRLHLDLGEIYEIAAVEANDVPAGVAWYPPYRLDLTHALKPGLNTVRITVANQMKNSLGADDPYVRPVHAGGRSAPGAATSGDYYDRPSGLLGPVRLHLVHGELLPGRHSRALTR